MKNTLSLNRAGRTCGQRRVGAWLLGAGLALAWQASALPRLELDAVTAPLGASVSMSLSLAAGDQSYAGFAATIYLPAGVTFSGATVGDLNTGFTVDAEPFDDATGRGVRLLAFSDTALITGSDGRLLSIDLGVAADAGTGTYPVAFDADEHALSNADGTESVAHGVANGSITILPKVGSADASPRVLLTGSSVLVTADGLVAPSGIAAVTAVVRSPRRELGEADPTTLPTFALSELTPGTWTATVAGLESFGEHVIGVTVTDSNGQTSLPQEVTILQTTGPDAFEEDDTQAEASFIATDGTGQLHNFDAVDDKDWIVFYASNDRPYAITIFDEDDNCDSGFQLWDATGQRLLPAPDDPADWIDDNWAGGGESASWLCPADGLYFLRMSYAPEGETGDFVQYCAYRVKVHEETGSLAGVLWGAVRDQMGNPLQATVSLSSGLVMATVQGAFCFTLAPGAYNLVAQAEGGLTATRPALVRAGGVSTENFTFTIARPVLTVTADSKTRFYGDPNPVFTVQIAGFVGDDDVGDLDTPPTAACAATPASPAAAYAIVPSGGLDDCYDFAYVDGTLTVEPAPLTCRADDKSRPYGAANPAFTGTLTGVVAGDNITASYASAADATTPAGAYGPSTAEAIMPTLVDPDGRLANYAVTVANGTLTIGKAALSITANNSTRREGLANPPFTCRTSGLVGGDTLDAIGITISYECVADEASPPGEYDIVPAGLLGTANYAVAYVAGMLTVTAKQVPTIDWPAPDAIVYGTALDATQLNAEADTPGAFAYDPPAGTVLPAGTHTLTATFTPADGDNWTGATATVELTVEQAALTVTAADRGKTYGEAVVFAGDEFAVAGLVGDDTVAAVTLTSEGAAACAPVAGAPYAIVPSDAVGAGLDNYAIAYVNGTLAVARAALTVTANNATRRVGQANPAFSCTPTGLVCDDTLDSIGLDVAYACPADEASEPGDYPITPSGPGTTDNYTVTYVAGMLTVTAKQVPTITWPAPDAIVYGTPLDGTQLNAEADTPGAFVYDPPADTVLPAGTHTLKVSFVPADSDNWGNVEATVQISVTKASAAVFLAELNQIYDGTPRVVVASTTPPDLAVATVYGGDETAPVNVGTYAISAEVTDPNYDGRATDVLIVEKAGQEIVFAHIPDQPVTALLTLSASADSGLPIDYAIAGPATKVDNALSFTATGIVTVTASQVGDMNHHAADSVVRSFRVWTVVPSLLFRLEIQGPDHGTSVLYFGQAAGATVGYDEGLDWVDFEAGGLSSGMACFLSPAAPDPGRQRLQCDVRPQHEISRWLLSVDTLVPDGQAVSVSCTCIIGSTLKRVYLQSLIDEAPAGRPCDLLAAPSVEIPMSHSGIFEVALGPITETQCSLVEGWNLLGIPIMTETSAAELLADPSGARQPSVPAVWWWDGGARRTEKECALNPETAYWVLAQQEYVSRGGGGILADGLMILKPGWNVMSPVSATKVADCAIAPAGGAEVLAVWVWDATGQVYRFVGTQETLLPGQGYVIFVKGSSPVKIDTSVR